MKMNKAIAVFLVLSLSAGGMTGCGGMKNPVIPEGSPINSVSANNVPSNAQETTEASSVTESPTITLSDENTLKNPNATKEARILNNYIRNTYGQRILSGQQESTWVGSPEYEMDYIKKTSGRLPAIRGLDYINEDFDGVTQRAIEWWKQGGIVSICWHWGTPPDGVGYESSKGFADLKEMFVTGSIVNKGMLAQMDRVAEELKKLQDAGVPVLWRPYHEFDGGWFWWSRGGPETFKKLWTLMYDRFTNLHGLNNLIWVLGYSSDIKDGWYPGDAYVDIAGADHYGEGTQIQRCLLYTSPSPRD